jgi:large conductance mechanosensitive channel
MSILKEFREFAVKGNVIDLAVGVVIGGAFGKITTSLVNDIIMPPLGLLIGNVDFSALMIKLSSPIGNLPPAAINYGLFIQTLVNFLIIAMAMFFVVRAINHLKRKQETAPPEEKPAPPSRQEVLLEEIRDLLKTRTT